MINLPFVLWVGLGLIALVVG